MKPSRNEDTQFARPSRVCCDEKAECDSDAGEEEGESIKCPVCGYGFITKVNGKKKLRTRILVFARNGDAMGICPRCKTNLKVPVALQEGP